MHRTSPAACRFLFFAADMPAEELQRYCALLAAYPPHTLIDRSSAAGAAAPDNLVPQAPPEGGWRQLPPQRVFVGCGKADVLVDAEAAQETAAYFGTQAALWEGVPHDCMLSRWQEPAASLRHWLDTLSAAPLVPPRPGE